MTNDKARQILADKLSFALESAHKTPKERDTIEALEKACQLLGRVSDGAIISIVCRDDIKTSKANGASELKSISVKRITAITDAELEQIAEDMGDAYTGNDIFWIDLPIITEKVLSD